MASFAGEPISLNQLLANASVADTKHDFHTPISDIVDYLKKLSKEYNSGLPVGFDKIDDEDALMKYVFKDITKKDQRKIDLKTVPKIFITDFDIIENFETITNKVYSINKMQIEKQDGTYLTTAKQFTDALHIADYSAFVIDAASISINDILTNGDDTPKKTIYYIYDSELDNDPAGKTYAPDPIFKKTKGHKIISCFPKNIESSKNTNYYYSWDDEKNDPYNNFFTNYNFQLSGLQKIQQGKSTKYLTNLRINNKTDKLQTKVIVDSGKANAIDALKSLILDFFSIYDIRSKKKGKTIEDEVFGLNSCYQQKRSGDWLQVLLCMLIRERKYKNYETNDEITNISEIYLVTHDRIALCFALLMGVNVIFTHGHSRKAYSFKLNDPVQIEAILKAQIDKIKKDDFKIINDTIKMHDDFYTEYNEKIYKHYVPTCSDTTSAILDWCNKLNDSIEEYLGVNNKNLEPVFVSSIVTDATKNIFKHAVQQCHFKSIFPDVSTMVGPINKFKGDLEDFKIEVLNANTTQTKQIVVNKYNEFISITQTLLNTINIYVDKTNGNSKFNFSLLLPTFTKSPAYKAAQVWTWDISISSRYLDRLIEYVTAKNYKNDKNIFLYNLHDLDEECKQAIATTYAKLYAAIPDFKTKIDLQDKAIQSGKLSDRITGIFKSSRKTATVNLQKFSNVIQSFCVEVLLNLHVIDTNEIEKNITTFISKSIAIESLRYPIGNKITDKNYFPIIADVNIINENNKIINEPNIIMNSVNGIDDVIDSNEDKINIISGSEDSDTHNYVAYGNEDDKTLSGGMPININRRTGRLPNIIIEPNPKNSIYPLLTMHITYVNTDTIIQHLDEIGALSREINDIERQQLTYAERPDDFYGGNYMKGGEPDDIITDNSICFHPLLPLYMIFETYLSHITNDDITQSFDYEIFIKYSNVLVKCYDVYVTNYDNKESRMDGYIIGMGLKELLFTSNMDKDNYKFCYESLDMNENEYYAMSSLSCTLSYMISGIIMQTNVEKQQAKLFLTNKIFKNFTGLVNARDIFLKPITIGYTIAGLIDMVKQKLLEIGEKIIQDRTNPIQYRQPKINYYLNEKSTNSTPDSVFSYSTTGSTGSSRSRGGNKTHRQNKKISRNNRVKHNKRTRRNRKTRKS